MPDPIKLTIAKTGITHPKGILSVNTEVKILPFSTIVIGNKEWSEFNLEINDNNGGISSSFGVGFGLLYTLSAAQRILSTFITPSFPEWRIPNDSDFNNLISNAGGGTSGGGKLKSIGTQYWNDPNTGATNSLLFNNRGAGYRDSSFVYRNFKAQSYIWGTDNILNNKSCLYVYNNSAQVSLRGRASDYYLSLRFVKDVE